MKRVWLEVQDWLTVEKASVLLQRVRILSASTSRRERSPLDGRYTAKRSRPGLLRFVHSPDSAYATVLYPFRPSEMATPTLAVMASDARRSRPCAGSGS